MNTIERFIRTITPYLVAIYVAGEWGIYQVKRFDRWLGTWAQLPEWPPLVMVEHCNQIDPSQWRVKDLKELLALRGIQVPSKARKAELLALVAA